MKLSEDQARVVIDYITRVSGGKPIICPICGNTIWNVNNIVTEMREFQNGDLVIGGNSAIMPFVSITCRHCANTLFVNAIQVGIVKPKEKQSVEINNPKEEK